MKLKSMKDKYSDHYILGIVDGEGSFHVSLKKKTNLKFGLQVYPEFSVYQHCNNRFVLDFIKCKFRCGKIYKKSGNNVCVYKISGVRNIREKVITFFDKYQPHIKISVYKTFKKIIESLERGDHTNLDGMKEIVTDCWGMNSLGKGRKWDLNSMIEIILKSSEATRSNS